MLTDWMTNLWAPEHYLEQSTAGGKNHATPERHRELVANVADEFLVTALKGNFLGLEVPNNYVAEYVREFPGRAVGLASVDPKAPNAAAELERAVKELGLHGLKLAPTFQNFDPWDKDAWEIYELAAFLGIPIYWHQSTGGANAPLEYANPEKLDKIARKFPDTPMLLEHFCLPWGNIGVALARKHENVYLDVCARLVRQWDMYNCLRLAMDYGITDKVIFGSDFPVQSTEEALSSLRHFATDKMGLPPIPTDIVESIAHDRPLSMIWTELAR